jgi:hypothetical protein
MTPSGTTTDDALLDMCLKNFHIARARMKLSKEGKDPETIDVAQLKLRKTPVDFWAFPQLHCHCKLSPTTSAGANDGKENTKQNKKRKDSIQVAEALATAPQKEFRAKAKLARTQLRIREHKLSQSQLELQR